MAFIMCPLCHKEHDIEFKSEIMKMPIGNEEFSFDIEYIECPYTGLRKMTSRLTNEHEQQQALYQLTLTLANSLPDGLKARLVQELGK